VYNHHNEDRFFKHDEKNKKLLIYRKRFKPSYKSNVKNTLISHCYSISNNILPAMTINKIGFFFVFTNPRPPRQAWAVGRKLMSLYMTMFQVIQFRSIPSCYPCLPTITLQKSSTKDKNHKKRKKERKRSSAKNFSKSYSFNVLQDLKPTTLH
jgi:hypothetical protein